MNPRSVLAWALLLGIAEAVAPNVGQCQVPEWRLVLESMITLPEEIGRVRGIAPLHDGTMAILDRLAPFVHLVDAKGTLVRSWVPRGEGPGSAVMPSGIGTSLDTIWVWDPGTGRMNYFDRTGTLIHNLPIRVPHPVYPLRPNRWLVVPVTAFGDRHATARTIALWLVDSIGRRKEKFLQFADSVPSFVIPRQGRMQVGRQPFVPPAIATPYPDVARNGVAVAFPAVTFRDGKASFRLWRINSDGKTIFDGQVSVEPRRIRASDVAFVVNQLALPDSTDADLRVRIRRALVIPPFLPALSFAMLGSNGETWIHTYDIDPAASGSWFIVSGQGKVIGTVAVPQGERVAVVVGDRVGMLGENVGGEPTFSWWRVVRAL